jgi:hypothetical protein
MKKLFILSSLILFCACATLTGSYSYIPVGPQNLSAQVEDPKNMPVFISRNDITRPWASIGLMRVKNLPNDRTVTVKQLERIKAEAAKKGANALIVNQYYDDDADPAYPITIAAYLVKYLDGLSDEDKAKIEQFATQAAIENASI